MFKILSKKNYKKLIDERDESRQEYYKFREQIVDLEAEQKAQNELIDELKKHKEDYEKIKSKYAQLSLQYADLKDQSDLEFSLEVDKGIEELGLNRNKIQALWADRTDLIELYIDKLYSLSKHYATNSRKMKNNRGLFVILVDSRNMVDTNFSEFHEGQKEHLMDGTYQGIDDVPQMFSEKIDEVFDYMGDKIPIKNEHGEVTGHEERDGAVLIDLKGVAFRSCLMVEGVRTHKVYNKVEGLMKGNAKHNAAIYASSLDEVMVAIVISEETSEVTMFRSGKFIKRYNPYTDSESLRKEKVVSMKHHDDVVDTESEEEKVEDKKKEVG